MDNRVGEMQVFVRVVESQSFSLAASQLQMTPSTVSKLVSRIEQRLGVRLIERSTRRLSLTAEGVTFYERAQALLAELDDIESSLSQDVARAKGKIRVNASVAFGVLGVEPLLPAFWAMHPNIVVDLSLTDDLVDIYLDRTDVVFRVGGHLSPGMVARRLGTAVRKIVASPEYLKRNGVPLSVDDLNDHNCLGFNFTRQMPVWPLKDRGRTVERAVRGSLLANNGETVRKMAVAGVGLARLGDYHVREDIATGRLVEVLADSGVGDQEEIYALYPGSQRLPQRTRAFLDFMVPRLQDFLAAQ